MFAVSVVYHSHIMCIVWHGKLDTYTLGNVLPCNFCAFMRHDSHHSGCQGRVASKALIENGEHIWEFAD